MTDEKTPRPYRMQPPRRVAAGPHAPAHHRERRGAARDARASAHLDQRRRRARRRAPLDLYRHFPDDAALFDACSAHWTAANPPPDLDGVGGRSTTPDERLRLALGELHAYYRRTERMRDNIQRDEDVVPLIAERFAAFHAYLAAARDALMAGRRRRGGGSRRTRGALGHAVAFSTWRSLRRENGLSEADAVGLLRALVAAA